MLEIATAADSKFTVPLHACLATIAEHASGSIVYVLDCGLRRSDREALRRTVGEHAVLRFISVRPASFQRLPQPSCGSVATYARLLLGDLLDVDRVLYLDADTLLRSSIAGIVRTDLSGHPMAAVREMYTPTVSAANGIKDWRAVGLDPDTPYFNAGVMVVDLPLWRSLDIRTQAIAYLQRTDITVTLFDQEALNAVVAGRWRELPPIWNATRYWYKSHRRTGPYASVLDEARILHFLSEDKPWTLNSKIPEAQTRAFYDALDRSDLAGWRP